MATRVSLTRRGSEAAAGRARLTTQARGATLALRLPDLRDLDQEYGHAHPRRDGPRASLAFTFTRYCYCQYCMVYSIQTRGRKGTRILSNNCALVLHQGRQCRWAGGMKEWLIRAHQLRSKRISCKGQAQALRTQGYTHVCVLKLANGSPCNHALKLTKGHSGTWLTTVFLGLRVNPRLTPEVGVRGGGQY